jgi:hypothetical protein
MYLFTKLPPEATCPHESESKNISEELSELEPTSVAPAPRGDAITVALEEPKSEANDVLLEPVKTDPAPVIAGRATHEV